MATGRKRRDIEERKARVARLLVERRSIREIATQLNVGKSTIERDVQEVRAEWQSIRLESIDSVVAGELVRLAAAEAIIWPLIRFGDLRAVDRLLRIMERRASLLGLDAPTKVDITEYVREKSRAAGLSDEDVEAAVREAGLIAKGGA